MAGRELPLTTSRTKIENAANIKTSETLGHFTSHFCPLINYDHHYNLIIMKYVNVEECH